MESIVGIIVLAALALGFIWRAKESRTVIEISTTLKQISKELGTLEGKVDRYIEGMASSYVPRRELSSRLIELDRRIENLEAAIQNIKDEL